MSWVLLLIIVRADLHGSDLENMSLSKRFLKEGEKEEVSTAQERRILEDSGCY